MSSPERTLHAVPTLNHGSNSTLSLIASGGEASAQEQRFTFSLGGGNTAPNSEVRDHLGDGYNINVGFQVNVTPIRRQAPGQR